ncbi:hypothetical protein [Nubsella zeaxanthinifaciens]|uniref:hypothetical protein n=1 Tax=Nubsella zeaxanthinifaciens TaxID=392412 RepID=UPI0013002DED|nr:hypothetical protein [Nubsella zeaxanthinifaciens]
MTYYKVSPNGDYISVTPLISQVTVSAGSDFRKTDTETEITESEFKAETEQALSKFGDATSSLIFYKLLL